MLPRPLRGSRRRRGAAISFSAQEVDVLIWRLNGHTQRGSLDILRRRPSPVQVGWLGYAGTSGAPFIDTLIADRIVAPNPQAFSERLEYLPGSFFVTDTTRVIGAVPSRAEAGLPESGFVFCGFNHVMKLGSVLLRALDAHPGAGARQRVVAQGTGRDGRRQSE